MEILSASADSRFVEVWYDIAPDDHFWVRHRGRILADEIAALGLDARAPLLGLDIGCGHGVVQRQLTENTSWTVDGCDLNKEALQRNGGHRGRVFYYDINDRREELRERYDFIIMFDVIEHVAEAHRFIQSAAFHLRTGGYAFVNVPALQLLFSNYDRAQGHVKRYNRSLLRQELSRGGFCLDTMRYWGMSMVPIAFARKIRVAGMKDNTEIMRTGFEPAHPVLSTILSAVLLFEERAVPSAPFGTSLFASCRKLAAGSPASEIR